MPRIEYEGQSYPVTDEEVPDEEAVKSFLRLFSTRAADADVEVDVQDGEKIYRVTARAAGKGNDLAGLLAALDQGDRFVQPAIAMAEEMEGMDPTRLLFERDRIKKAYENGKAEFQEMQSIREAIGAANAIPAAAVPAGF